MNSIVFSPASQLCLRDYIHGHVKEWLGHSYQSGAQMPSILFKKGTQCVHCLGPDELKSAALLECPISQDLRGVPLREVHMLQRGPQLLEGIHNIGHPGECCLVCVARVSCTSHVLFLHPIRSILCGQASSFCFMHDHHHE